MSRVNSSADLDIDNADLGDIDLGDLGIPLTSENIELIETIMSTFFESLNGTDLSTIGVPQTNPVHGTHATQNTHDRSHILMRDADEVSDDSTNSSTNSSTEDGLASTDELREIFTDLRSSFIILTDRNTEFSTSKWMAEDIIMFDDLYNFNNGKYNKTRKMAAFKNRHKLIVVPENRIRYIHTILCGDLLVPHYVVFMSNPLGVVDQDLTALKENNTQIRSNHLKKYKVAGVLHILESKIGLTSTPHIQSMVYSFIVRIIVNGVVRGSTSDTVIRTVLNDLIAMRGMTHTEICTTEDLMSLIGCDCTEFLDDCISIINKFGLFNGYLTYQKFRVLLDVAEKLFGNIKNAKDKKQPIVWRPVILTMIVSNFSRDEITDFIWHIIRDSQLCKRKKYKYVILPDTIKMFGESFYPSNASSDKALHIVDCCSDTIVHRALTEIWQDIEQNDLSKHGIKTVYPDRWAHVKHLFEPSIMVLYVSMFWVMAGYNTAEDASAYISRILFSRSTVRSRWRNLYSVYFANFSNIIDICNMYIEKAVYNATYEYDGTELKNNDIGGYGSEIIRSILTKNIISQKQLNDMFRNIARGLEYYASLKKQITLFDTYARATDTRISEMDGSADHGLTVGLTFDKSDIVPDCIGSTKPDVWLTWDTIKSLSLKTGSNLCCKGEADSHKLCKKKKCVSCNANRPKRFGYYRFLTCNNLIGMGEHLERLMIIVKPSLHRINRHVLSRFVHSLAKTMNYHYTESDIQHTFEIPNIEYLIYIDMFYDMMTHSIPQLRFCRIFTKLNMAARTFEIDRSIDTTRAADGTINQIVNQTYGLNFRNSNISFVFSKLIDMFYAIKAEVERLDAYYTRNGEMDADTGLVAYYTKHHILDKVIQHNDLVGMLIVLTNEIGNGIMAVGPLFTKDELKNSPIYKLCKANPFS